MMDRSQVIVVGAGPYGLSIAAHLRAAGIGFRIFGNPMQVWRERMPDGMLLKSDGFASNLSDPHSAFTLQHYCDQNGIPYDHKRRPVSLDTFRAYGLAFQQRLVPELEHGLVTSLERDENGFRVGLENGRSAAADNVVVAVGISHFHYVPPVLGQLPQELVSHSSFHKDPVLFKGKVVTVVGGGASGIDLAVLLHEAGAAVSLITRRPALKFNDPPAERPSWWDAVRHPTSPIGPGWRARFYSDFPWLFHRLPEALRLRIVRAQHGSAAGWSMKPRFEGRVKALLESDVQGASARNGRACLQLPGPFGLTEHVTDYVIAATGFRVDLRRLGFLSPGIRSELRTLEHTPVLSPHFESSVRGMYFVGVASSNSFGPMMRFACGADWTARRLSEHLARSESPSLSRAAARRGSALVPHGQRRVKA